ncbi:hypothetical protein B566_EDAN014718 [Ephemera danica]|nr:hypothetical protein B566_EDAN014718 [Ephemera danica]
MDIEQLVKDGDVMASVEESTWGGQDPDETADRHHALAVRCTGFGGYDMLKVQRIELPKQLPSGHIEVQVHACGMNFADLYTRQGLMRDRKPPFTLGMECTGQVVSVAPNVTNFKFTGGLHQEFVVLPATCCFPLPDGVPYDDGAALIVNYLTAYFCVVDIGNLQPGQSILVHSCVGGVGWACTQLAHTVTNVTVYGTCSTTSKHEAARQNGVKYVFDPATYESELRSMSPQGVHLVVDSIGGANFTISQRILQPLGRAVLTGASSMIQGERRLSFLDMICIWWRTRGVSATDLMMQNMVVSGLHLGNLMRDDLARVQAAMREIFLLYIEAKVKPRIDSVWPFEKIVDATKVLQERRNIGKVLLKPTIK